LIALASVPAVRLFGRRRAFPILLLLIVAYTVFVGASASVVRAAIELGYVDPLWGGAYVAVLAAITFYVCLCSSCEALRDQQHGQQRADHP
jgi:hypothetical protein